MSLAVSRIAGPLPARRPLRVAEAPPVPAASAPRALEPPIDVDVLWEEVGARLDERLRMMVPVPPLPPPRWMVEDAYRAAARRPARPVRIDLRVR